MLKITILTETFFSDVVCELSWSVRSAALFADFDLNVNYIVSR